MDVKHDLSELQAKLTDAGWTLSRVEQRSGAYIAKGESPSGEKAERGGDTPHMALANLVRFALRNNQMQSYAKTSAWNTDWLGKHEEIAADYRKLPVFDQKALPAYNALAEESAQQAAEIRKQVHVEVVDTKHPYKSAAELREDVHTNRHLAISKSSLDHPIWKPEQVLDFRIVHDVIGHAQGGGEFSWRGQNVATAAHMPHVSPLARQALFTQTIGQASEFKTHRMFGPPRVGLMKHWVEPANAANGEHVDVPYTNVPHAANVSIPTPPIDTRTAVNEHGFTNDETMALALAIEHKPGLKTKAMSIMTLAPATIEAWLRQVADVLDTELGIDASKVDMAQVIGGLENDAARENRRDGHTFQQGDRIVYNGPAFAGDTMGTIEQVLKSPNLSPGTIPQPYQYRLRVRLDNGHTIPDTQGDSVKVMPKGPDSAPDTLPDKWTSTLPAYTGEYKDSDKVRKLKNKLREGASAARMGKYALQIGATKPQLKKATKDKSEDFREKAVKEYTKLKKGGMKSWTLLRSSAYFEDDWDTEQILMYIENDPQLQKELRQLVGQGMSPTDIAKWGEKVVLAVSKAAAEWMDDPEADLNDYMVDPAKVNWQEIWQHAADRVRENTQYQTQDVPNTIPEHWGAVEDVPESDLPEDWKLVGDDEPIDRHPGRGDREWKTARVSSMGRLSSVLQSHMIRLTHRLAGNKVDKLAEKARLQLWKRPDVEKWVENANLPDTAREVLKEFFDKAPSDAFKLYPWMWTQIRNSPAVLHDPSSANLMYEIGTAFHTLNRANKPTPDIHKLNLDDASDWYQHEAKPMLDEMKPMEWRDPKHHLTLSDKRHVIHQITNASDAQQEGDVMGHCVGGYGSQIESGDTNIFSIRDDKHKPHVTIEMIPVDKPQRKTYDELKEGDRILVGDRTHGPVMGATVLARGPEWGEYTIQRDDAHDQSRVSVNHVRGYYPGRFKTGDMVMPLYKPQWLDMSKAPFRVNSIHIGESSIGYYLDTKGAADNANAYMDETHLTAEDGSIPDKPEVPDAGGNELPTEHRVTQVFGKGDQAPIAKYRKMTREWFDHLRDKGHTLHWAGNDFLPDNVTSMDEAEEVFDFLDNLQDHMNDHASRDEPEPTIDALGMGHSLIETGAMAHQYGFEDVDPEVMKVDWSRLMEDFSEQLVEASSSYGYSSSQQEDLVKHVLAVAHVKGMSDDEILRKIDAARDRARDMANDKINEEANQSMDNNWHEIREHADEINASDMDDYAREKGHHVDHSDKTLWTPEQHDHETGDVHDDHRSDAEDAYRDRWDDGEEDAEQSARDSFMENYESEGDYDVDEHFDAVENALNPFGKKVRILIDEAMNEKLDDRQVNSRWADVLAALGRTPETYAQKTHSSPNRMMEVYKLAVAEVAKRKPPQGWQQQMPKGETPIYDVNERTEQVLETIERMAKKLKAEPVPPTGVRGVQQYAEQHSFHEPFHSTTPVRKAPAPQPYGRPNSNPGPAQRDIIVDHNNDQKYRPASPLKSVDGEGLIAGDVIEHPQYGRGTVEGVTGDKWVRLHFPSNGGMHGPIEGPYGTGTMKRVGGVSDEWTTAADEWDHPEAWEGARAEADEWASNVGPAHPNWNPEAWKAFEAQLAQGRSGMDAYNAVLAALLDQGLTPLDASKGAKEAWMHWLQMQEDIEDGMDAQGDLGMDQPGLGTAPIPPEWKPLSPSQQSQLQNVPKRQGRTAAEHEREEDPESIFVYYMGELRMEDWHHNRRYKELVKDFFASHGTDMADFAFASGVDEHDIALGVVYRDGTVEHHQLTRPEIREEAERAILAERTHPEGDAAPPSPAVPVT